MFDCTNDFPYGSRGCRDYLEFNSFVKLKELP